MVSFHLGMLIEYLASRGRNEQVKIGAKDHLPNPNPIETHAFLLKQWRIQYPNNNRN